MRRPVKPFVTEYRGGQRRQGFGGSSPKPDFSNLDMDQPLDQPPPLARAEPRPAALSARHAEAQEDSYEAAMRAADALFSARQPAPAAEKVPPDATSADAASADAPHAGGRVLRVLDEAPSPEMLRLEAEHAPKRRGRKPGSKNKPKIAPAVTQAALHGSTGEGSTGEASAEAGAWDDDAWDDDAWDDHEGEAATPAPAASSNGPAPRAISSRPHPRIRAVALDAATEPRAGDKYAWVRTKLKPGQQWKRRLPKVAW